MQGLNAPAGAPNELPRPALFRRTTILGWALLCLIFAVGLAVRLYRLSDPPVDFHPTRQLHSALIARGMYYERDANVPEWERNAAVGQWRAEGLIEPQVFERLVAWTYARVGDADLRVPRLYAIAFWMIAAGFLAVLSVELVGWGGALIALLFFLAWPYSVTASRAFQPEPLLLALMIAALWAAVRWERATERAASWCWAIAAGVLAGLAIYIKSVGLFLIGPAFLVLAVSHSGFDRFGFNRARVWRLLRNPQVWLMGVLALLPYALYMLDGLYLHRYLVSQFSLRFFPGMWLDPAFYLRWISNLGRAVPFEMVLVALLGPFLLRRPVHRYLLMSLWIGYVVYGLTLPHHISTHDYYHLPLFPVVALGLAAVAETLFNHLRGPAWLARTAAVGLVLAALVINTYTARTQIKRSGAVEQTAAWQAIGQTIGSGAGVVALVPDYGCGMKYWGWDTPIIWPSVDEMRFLEGGVTADFNALYQERAAGRDYFVVTMFDELDRQPGLKKVLAGLPVLKEGPGYRIYDLRQP